jgi:peptidoglycan/xylan/chitin deacetylase (PgdA/CDA1 family)
MDLHIIKRKESEVRRMKTSKTKKSIAVIFIAVLMVYLSFSVFLVSGKTYSDIWVLGYRNMEPAESETNVVPTLYKNDAVFGNHRRFPLVVQGNVHYVPVEMFSGLSGIKLTYGYSISYFYLATRDNARYISFDIENDAVTTHERETYTLKTKIFYNTRYLPAEEVARVLGLKLEIYENPQESVYALRLCDSKAKTSFAELIKMYSPIKKDDASQSNNGSEAGRRNIYITFDTTSFYGMSETLSSLQKYFPRKSAVFFVAADDILARPDEIRQIIASGHSVGIILKGPDFESEYLSAKENLRLVAKRSTRLVRFAAGSTTKALTDEQYKDFVGKYGLCVWDYNKSIPDSRKIQEELYNFTQNTKVTNIVMRLYHGSNSASAIKNLYEFAKSRNQLRINTIDETVKSVSYR